MKLLILVVLIFLFVSCVILDNTYRTLPLKELRRRARDKNNRSSNAIYKMSALGMSIELLLWIIGSLSAAGILLIAISYSWWFDVIAALAMGWFIRKERPATASGGWQWRASGYLAPPFTSVALFFQPVLRPIGEWLARRHILPTHSGLFEKEDLVEFIEGQMGFPENRIPEAELKMAASTLTFGDKTVESVMTPRRVLKMVNSTDSIGPHLMDELHASGFSRFPVIKEETKALNPDIIGILYLRDLVMHGETGNVRDLMKKKVYYINETQSLREALAAFLATEHHMLIVVNNFEEITGVITIEDVLEQVIGEKIVDEFDRYDDMRAVAGIEAAKDRTKHTQPEVIE